MSLLYEDQIIWAQVDANMHLRHSAYADLAAQARIALLDTMGLDFNSLKKLNLGPILFREELQYLREVNLNEKIKIKTTLLKARKDGSRWSFRHELYRADDIKAAIITVDGAWMDLEKRKLCALPTELAEKFLLLSPADDFVLED